MRSTSVARCPVPPSPLIRSPSQWPTRARFSTVLGRSSMSTRPGILPRPALRYFFASLLRVLRCFLRFGNGGRTSFDSPLADKLLTAVVLLVERFHAHHRDAVAPAAPGGHLGRPALPELLLEELPHLVRELPPLCGLHGDAVPGHALGLLVPASFLALVPIQLARDDRNRAADPGGNVRFRLSLSGPPAAQDP